VKVTAAAIFAAGYVMGSRAGRERYAEIIAAMAKASQRLEEFSARRPPGGGARTSVRADGSPRSHEALV
jgi:hypothetical protein